jgi:hypothetical protein
MVIMGCRIQSGNDRRDGRKVRPEFIDVPARTARPVAQRRSAAWQTFTGMPEFLFLSSKPAFSAAVKLMGSASTLPSTSTT